ncbi:hypothetical protein SSX86_025463 [Deinandra increscens subsp. villosa]|uniref:J domain-containing protein n=1 Tax=Deinandra increscens subsp. villosa TaxID=3103831 RepID=A0AAP0CDC5_9ASTR
MESLSRPLHRRKLSNANSFSGKNAYDGVFSGHRPKYAGAPAVNVEEYREIFYTGQAGSSSIPVLDPSALEESSDELDMGGGSSIPDYGLIFGGFRDLDIAISYEELVARDKARASSATSRNSQDLGDLSPQSSDDLKQFSMSYNKISQRSKDGADVATHVTKLHDVPGFTCFIDESGSQPNKEIMKQKLSSTNNTNVNSSKRDFPEKHTTTDNVKVNSSKPDFPEKQTTTDNVKVNSNKLDFPEKQTTTDKGKVNLSKPDFPEKKTTTDNVKVNLSKPDFPEKQTTTDNVKAKLTKPDLPEKQTTTDNVKAKSSKPDFPEKQTTTDNVKAKSSKPDFPEKQTTTDNVKENSTKPAFLEKQTSQSSVEFRSRHQEESLSGEKIIKKFEADLKSYPSKVLPSPELEKETEKRKSPAMKNVPTSAPATSQAKKETEKQKPSVTNNVHPSEKVDFPEKQTPQIAVESQSRYSQDESFSDDRNVKTFKADFKSYSFKVSSSPAASASNLDNHKDYQKKSTARNEEFPPTCFAEDSEVNSAAAALRKAIEKAQESIRMAKESVGRNKEGLKGFSSRSFKNSLKVKAKVANAVAGEEQKEKDDFMKERDHKNGSTVIFPEFANSERLFGAKKVVNETHGNITESVQSSEIPIKSNFPKFAGGDKLFVAKKVVNETHGNISEPVKNSEIPTKSIFPEFSDGEKPFGAKKVVNETHENITESVQNSEIPIRSIFSECADSEKLFNAKKVVDETHGNISESVKNSEIPIRSIFPEFADGENFFGAEKVVEETQVVGRTEAESIESNTCEDQQEYNERPNGFLVLESCETKLGDTESNDLTVCQKMETEEKMYQTSDQNGFENKFSDESFGLLENNMQENLEQEHDEEVASAKRQDEDERQVKEDGGTESHSEEDNFYDVCEVEMNKNAQTYAVSIEKDDSSQKEDYENQKAEETYEISSSDYDDAEENENVIGASSIVDDTEEACKVDQNDNNAESSQEIDDVGSSHEFHVEYKAVEKEIFENFSSDETETEDEKVECEAKSINLENCGLADVDFGQNDVQFEPSMDTIHGMEIEVKECQESEETVDREENNVHQSHEETPEIRIEMDTGTPQEPKDECRESEPIKVAHKKEERERDRIKLAVERVIREARERALAEVRQRVLADTQEKVIKASIDKTSAQSKLKAERALVERATAEARKRALEKAMRISEPRTQVSETKQTPSTSQTTTESALRSKAKLEKHNRIMERAAKALAEKERRDLLALREQAERSRLAENLDADIKRWSTGKEGNLRALLSTLQYILGAESGWQPLSLTEIITTSAVKKAYRKATLCVHPDKLQQRGASIQQKYICEKVFDLLKAAWNRFNSEER